MTGFTSTAQRRALLIDLDGTLVDTAPDLTRVLNDLLGEAGLEPLPAAEVRALVGRGARRLIEHGFARHAQPLGCDELDALVAAFLHRYERCLADESRPFPGAVEALEALREEAITLCICTNKPLRLAVALLETLSLSRFFASIVGGDSIGVKKPDPAPARLALEQAGGCERAAFIGDTEVDVRTARALGIGVAVMRFGYNPPEPGSVGAGDVYLDAWREVPRALDRLWASPQLPRGTDGQQSD
jgi:phosphoglycolate phosphatase